MLSNPELSLQGSWNGTSILSGFLVLTENGTVMKPYAYS